MDNEKNGVVTKSLVIQLVNEIPMYLICSAVTRLKYIIQDEENAN